MKRNPQNTVVHVGDVLAVIGLGVLWLIFAYPVSESLAINFFGKEHPDIRTATFVIYCISFIVVSGLIVWRVRDIIATAKPRR